MTQLNHEQRKRASDESNRPKFYYTYILQFADGGFYVGSTANPAARWTEHAINGAEATAGKKFTVRLVQQFMTRREAEYNESRIQSALRRGVKNVEAMIDNFNRISQMLRPEKTFSQLKAEEDAYINEMTTVFHHTTALTGFYNPAAGTACGWNEHHYGTSDWEALIKQARIEDQADKDGVYINVGRRVCRRCLELAPEVTA